MRNADPLETGLSARKRRSSSVAIRVVSTRAASATREASARLDLEDDHREPNPVSARWRSTC
jgi:hypothetical protein